MVHSDVAALQPGDIEEADDGVAGQVDEHSDGKDQTGNIWVDPIFARQTLEGDREGCDGGGSAKVDKECLEIKKVLERKTRKLLPRSCRHRREEDFCE